jgi:hypothetical protein
MKYYINIDPLTTRVMDIIGFDNFFYLIIR